MTDSSSDRGYATAREAERMLGFRLEPFLETEPGDRANAQDFMRIATIQAFAGVARVNCCRHR
jgi:hypothetical protein